MTTFNTLKSDIFTFKTLSHLEVGDRPGLDQNKKLHIWKAPKYKVGQFCQAAMRTFYQDKTELTIERIKAILKDTASHLDHCSTSNPTNAFDYLKEFHRLKHYVGQFRDQAIPCMKKTIETGCSHFIMPTKEIVEKNLGELRMLNPLIEQLNSDVEKKIDELEKSFIEVHKKAVIGQIIYQFTGKSPYSLNETAINSISRKAAEEAFTDFFGERITKDVLAFYGLDRKGVLDAHDIAALTVGIRANLTLQDLELLLSKSQKNSFLKMCFPHLNTKNESLFNILDQIRKIQVEEVDILGARKRYQSQLYNDVELLKACEFHKEFAWNKDDKHPLYKLQQLGDAEYISRDVIYGLFTSPSTFSKGVLIPSYRTTENLKSKELTLLQAWPISGGDGLYAALILPAQIECGKPLKLEIAFRGTYDTDSVLRDLSPLERKELNAIEGPGAKTYAQKLPEIKKNFLTALDCLKQEYNIPEIDLVVRGHSLGSTDSLSFQLDCLKWNNEMPLPAKIKSIEFIGFNPPYIDENSSSEFLTAVKDAKFTVTNRYMLTSSDLVQKTGKTLPGYCKKGEELPSNLKVSVFVFDRVNAHNQNTALQEINSHGSLSALQKRGSYFWGRHTNHCFTLHDDVDTRKQNPTFLKGLYTNNPEDAKLCDQPCIDKTKLNDMLITSIGTFADKLTDNVAYATERTKAASQYFAEKAKESVNYFRAPANNTQVDSKS